VVAELLRVDLPSHAHPLYSLAHYHTLKTVGMLSGLVVGLSLAFYVKVVKNYMQGRGQGLLRSYEKKMTVAKAILILGGVVILALVGWYGDYSENTKLWRLRGQPYVQATTLTFILAIPIVIRWLIAKFKGELNG